MTFQNPSAYTFLISKSGDARMYDISEIYIKIIQSQERVVHVPMWEVGEARLLYKNEAENYGYGLS